MNATAVSSSFASNLSESEREKLRAQLTSQISELNRQDELERAARRIPLIDQIKKLIAEHKILPTELFPTKDKAEARYRYYDEEEQNPEKRSKTWNGRGTMPKALKGREEECLMSGQEHTMAIKNALKERALNQLSTALPTSEIREVQAVSNVLESHPSDLIAPAVRVASHESTRSSNFQSIEVTPVANTLDVSLAGQESSPPIASIEAVA